MTKSIATVRPRKQKKSTRTTKLKTNCVLRIVSCLLLLYYKDIFCASVNFLSLKEYTGKRENVYHMYINDAFKINNGCKVHITCKYFAFSNVLDEDMYHFLFIITCQDYFTTSIKVMILPPSFRLSLS